MGRRYCCCWPKNSLNKDKCTDARILQEQRESNLLQLLDHLIHVGPLFLQPVQQSIQLPLPSFKICDNPGMMLEARNVPRNSGILDCRSKQYVASVSLDVVKKDRRVRVLLTNDDLLSSLKFSIRILMSLNLLLQFVHFRICFLLVPQGI